MAVATIPKFVNTLQKARHFRLIAFDMQKALFPVGTEGNAILRHGQKVATICKVKDHDLDGYMTVELLTGTLKNVHYTAFKPY